MRFCLRGMVLGLGLAGLAGCSGVTVSFGDLEPLPGVDEWINPEAPITVETLRYLRNCHSAGEETRVLLLPDAAAVQALQSERGIDLLSESKAASTSGVGAYVLVELGMRSSIGDGFAVSRSGGRRGATALIKITGLSHGGESAADTDYAPCALLSLPPSPKGAWSRVRMLDQVSGMRVTSEPIAIP